jgi:hypothetical protein
MKYFAVSRQMVLFAVERRKAWRMLQSKAGVTAAFWNLGNRSSKRPDKVSGCVNQNHGILKAKC